MPAKPAVVVVGAGGHALVSIDVLRSSGHDVAGCVSEDGSASAEVTKLGTSMMGTLADIQSLVDDDYSFFVAIGDNRARRSLTDVVLDAGGRIVTAVSPNAVVATTATVAPGTLVMPGAVINALTTIEAGAILNTGCSVDHECAIGQFAHIAPRAALAGRVVVGQEAFIGIGASVIPGRRIGATATVGAGAAVLHDVPDGATVVGVPAREVGARRAPEPQVSASAGMGEDRIPRVLVVCTGNLCRSPLAQAVLAQRLSSADLAAEVSSAGLAAPSGRSPDDKLVRVGDELGVDVRAHRSAPITTGQVENADLILTMTVEHARQVVRLVPDAASRTVPLREAAWKARAIPARGMAFERWAATLAGSVPEVERATHPANMDIPDPIGRPLRKYRAMAADVVTQIDALVTAWPRREGR